MLSVFAWTVTPIGIDLIYKHTNTMEVHTEMRSVHSHVIMLNVSS